MPFDGTDPGSFEIHPLCKLGAVERLLATEQQWCKGKLRDSGGRHCLVGAMQAVEARQMLVCTPRERSAGSAIGGSSSFNDDPRTTHADVLRVLRLARKNIITGMIEGERHGPWRQRMAQAIRALRSGSFGDARDAFRFEASAPKPVTPEPAPRVPKTAS